MYSVGILCQTSSIEAGCSKDDGWERHKFLSDGRGAGRCVSLDIMLDGRGFTSEWMDRFGTCFKLAVKEIGDVQRISKRIGYLV